MGGGEGHISTGYSQNKVFKIAPKQTVYSALSISENFKNSDEAKCLRG